MLPFSHDEFVQVFVAYNRGIWPMQVVAYGIGALIVGAASVAKPATSRLGLVLLGGLWAWTGVVYHWGYFAAINPAALGFGALFLAEGVLLAVDGLRGRADFRLGLRWESALALALIAYSLVAYPLVGMWTGQSYPGLPTFGVTPCPLTIFTFGILLLGVPVPPWRLMVIPVLWSFIGGSAAILLQVPQDWPLLASAVVVVPVLWHQHRKAALPSRTPAP